LNQPSRVGIFGGSFNPFHLGHLNSLVDVQKRFELDQVRVIPSYQTPGKPFILSPTPSQRLDMVKIGLEDYSDVLIADDREVQRGGISYTVDSIKEIQKEHPQAELYLIVGADILQTLNTWKNYEQILSMVNLVVTTRPGTLLPYQKEDLVFELQNFIVHMERERAELTTGKTIQYYALEDVDVSGTEIRKCIRAGLKVDKYLSIPVEKYIREHRLYEPSELNQLDFKDITQFCAGVLFEKKGFSVRAVDLTKCTAPSEWVVIASGTSSRHSSSLGENVIQQVKKKYGLNPLSAEGIQEGRWVLVDYGALIVHIFYDFVRQEYRLEDLWKGGQELEVRDPTLEQNPH